MIDAFRSGVFRAAPVASEAVPLRMEPVSARITIFDRDNQIVVLEQVASERAEYKARPAQYESPNAPSSKVAVQPQAQQVPQKARGARKRRVRLGQAGAAGRQGPQEADLARKVVLKAEIRGQIQYRLPRDSGFAFRCAGASTRAECHVRATARNNGSEIACPGKGSGNMGSAAFRIKHG